MESFLMSTKELNAVLAQIPTYMTVSKTESTVKVTATKKSDGSIVKILSAVHGRGGWHVHAVPGLISK